MQQPTKSPNIIIQQQKNIHQQISEGIEKGNIQIPQLEKPLIKEKQKVQEKDHHQKMISKISRIKNKTLQNLQQLQEQQRELISKIRKSKSPDGKSPQRSKYTEEQKQSIKLILKNKKRQQLKMKEKHGKIINSFIQKMNEERQKQKQHIEEERRRNHERAHRHLKSLQENKGQKDAQLRKIEQNLKEVKKRKYLFQINKQKIDETLKIREELERDNKMQKIRKQHELNISQLKEHQKNHRRILKEKQKERRQRIMTEERIPKFHKYEDSVFTKILTIQDEEKKEVDNLKRMQPFVLRTKIREFESYVRKNHKPKHLLQKDNKSSIQKSKSRSNALSYVDRVKQGNENLKFARSKKKEKNEQRLLTQPKIQKKYENYLLQMRKGSNKYGTVQQFRTMIDSERATTKKDYSTAAKATELAQEIDLKSKKSKDEKMYESIKNKLDILSYLL